MRAFSDASYSLSLAGVSSLSDSELELLISIIGRFGFFFILGILGQSFIVCRDCSGIGCGILLSTVAVWSVLSKDVNYDYGRLLSSDTC